MSEQSFLLESPEAIEGIGPERVKKLKDGRIDTIADMFAARAPRVRKLLGNVSPRQVGDWFCAATLMRVEGISPDIAEVLVNEGIRSVSQLGDAGLQTLERAVKAGVDAGKIPSAPSIYKLADLQREAWRARDRGMLAGQVLDDQRAPISGAHVQIGPYDMDTDQSGRYAFHAIPQGEVNIMISVDAHRELKSTRKTVSAGKLTGPVKHKLPPPPATPLSPTTIDEFDGELIVHTARTSHKLEILPLDQFREGTYFLVREFRSDGRARLLSLFKRRVGTTIYIQRALVATDEMPPTPQVGDVLLLTGGRLDKTSLTTLDVARLKREKWEQTRRTSKRRIIRF